MTFGEMFKYYRAKRSSMRQFCLANGYDSGNISKLERGVLLPPRNPEKLIKLISALKIDRTDMLKLLDIADKEHAALKRRKKNTHCPKCGWEL